LVGAERVRAALRDLFADWGLPGTLRVDNGAPWGSPSDWPTDLTLWLIGLGVSVRHNPPRRPQANGQVERDHAVLRDWADPGACADVAAVTTALAAACRIQREAYPAIDGVSRATAFPTLMCGGRPFDPAHEADTFDERRVWQYLATRCWKRRVDRVGRISVANRPLGVGRAWRGQTVLLQLDAQSVTWTVRDEYGRELARHPAPELSRARLLALTVSHKR
jgi:hypothetical protein